jgi:uncharacterized membrane protein
MNARLLNLLESLRANYWLVPALMAAAVAIGLAFLTPGIDARRDMDFIDRLR